ncbi:MAG: aminoacyl-tRNA hydrolase [Methyloligellaceae bacterium]
MKLFVGLGNPGKKYARHRHNVGYMVADEIARAYSFESWRKRFQGEAAEGRLGNAKCLLLKPTTYMNESGQSVGEAVRYYKIPTEDVVVFYDEIDLQPGKVRVKSGGGSAGHNGIKSLTSHIGSEFVRVRIGIGHPGRKDLVHRYVLHDFSAADREWLDPLLDAMVSAAARLAADDRANFTNEVAQALQNDAAADLDGRNKKQTATAPQGSTKTQTESRAEKHESPFAARLKQWLKINES